MIVIFEEEYLKDMYETGKTDKKHRYQPEIIRGYNMQYPWFVKPL